MPVVFFFPAGPDSTYANAAALYVSYATGRLRCNTRVEYASGTAGNTILNNYDPFGSTKPLFGPNGGGTGGLVANVRNVTISGNPAATAPKSTAMSTCSTTQSLHHESVRLKWKTITIAILLCLVVLFGITFLLRDDGPRFENRPLSQWLRMYGDSDERTAEHIKAQRAIQGIGTNALPFLLKYMAYEPRTSGLQRQAKLLVRHVPAVLTPEKLRDWAYTDRGQRTADAAALALSLFTNHTDLVIPELVRLMNNRGATNASVRALFALACLGEKAVSPLLAHLADTNAPNRNYAAGIFSQFPALSANYTPVVTQLVRCLGDHEPRVRDIAAYSLGQIAARQPVMPEFIIPALTNCLRDGEPVLLRGRAIWAIGNYKQDARSAEPLLLQFTLDSNEGIRSAATNAIRQIHAPPR